MERRWIRSKAIATRDLLHRNSIGKFEEYLKANGWVIQETKGLYEVLRAVNYSVRKRPLIIYDGKSKEHLSIDSRDFRIVRNFINSKEQRPWQSI